MLRRVFLGVVTLSSAACVVDAPKSNEVASTSQAVSLGECRQTGLYQAGIGQSWNRLDVTVVDYRTCVLSDGDNHLNPAFVAHVLDGLPGAHGTTEVPAFAPYGPEGAYRVFAPIVKQNHKLLIYLPGEGSSTADKEQLLQRAAYLGYHVLAVRFWNDDGGGEARCGDGPEKHGPDKGKFINPHTSCKYDVDCNPYTDQTPVTYDDCAIRFYTSVWDNGGPGFTPAHVAPHHSPFSLALPMPCGLGMMKNGTGWDFDTCEGVGVGASLTKGDAVLYRVRKLLTYLEAVHPLDGWGQFKDPGKATYDEGAFLDWSRVTLMAHSTGSKVLFHVVHDRKVDRAIFLSGPNLPETRAGKEAPGNLDSYVDTPAKTPIENIYAFSDTHDPEFHRAAAIWTNMKGKTLLGGNTVGLLGAAWGEDQPGVETMQACDNGHVNCEKGKPHLPYDSFSRAIRYSGNVDCQVNQIDCAEGNYPHAHESTTSDHYSCSSNNPDDCWYLDIWDYLLDPNR